MNSNGDPNQNALRALNPGHPLFFERRMGERSIKTSAGLVGFEGQGYILAHMPYVSGQPLFSNVDAECVVRFLDRGVIYGFTSQVFHLQHKPFPLIILTFPENVDRINLRSEERLPVNVPAVVGHEHANGNKDTEGIIVDLSRSGCRLNVPANLDLNSQIKLSFAPEGGPKLADITGEIRNVRSLTEGWFEYGVAFQAGYDQLHDYVDRLVQVVGH
ncbi:MAG: flagellar brake protein [Proteobacteria bacterium]|nr:flagellar brake protein [Pseudomonadota bacterium]MBU1742511.1 flagellar brake protein [Pseudomonadota bacterium]